MYDMAVCRICKFYFLLILCDNNFYVMNFGLLPVLLSKLLVRLTVITFFQVKSCGEASCESLFSAPIQGYMLGILSACLSALAGVYTEFLMKKNNDSLYWQNVQLYTYVPILDTSVFVLRFSFVYCPLFSGIMLQLGVLPNTAVLKILFQ